MKRPPGVPPSWVRVFCDYCLRGIWADPTIDEQASKLGQRIEHACSEACSAHLMAQAPSVLADMSNPAAPLWGIAALNPGREVDIGRMVACDDCGRDFTDSAAVGGMILWNRASCPDCMAALAHYPSPAVRARIKANAKLCPVGMSFADFVRSVRGSNNTIKIQP